MTGFSRTRSHNSFSQFHFRDLSRGEAYVRLFILPPAAASLCPHPQGYFRVNAFLPAVEAVLTNLRDRFSVHQRTAFLLIHLLPKNVGQVTWEQLAPVFQPGASLGGSGGRLPLPTTENSTLEPRNCTNPIMINRSQQKCLLSNVFLS